MNIKRIALALLSCSLSLPVIAGQSAPTGLQGNMPSVTSGVTSTTETSTEKQVSAAGKFPIISIKIDSGYDGSSSAQDYESSHEVIIGYEDGTIEFYGGYAGKPSGSSSSPPLPPDQMEDIENQAKDEAFAKLRAKHPDYKTKFPHGNWE